MSEITYHARHTVSGQIAEVPENIFKHVDLGKYWEIVDADAKPYLPEMHIPTTAPIEIDDDEDEDIEVEVIDINDEDKV